MSDVRQVIRQCAWDAGASDPDACADAILAALAEAGLAVVPKKAAEDAEMERLRKMMRDPRYWRDRDPEMIRQVAAGFRRLAAAEGARDGG